jgi:cytochrome P450
MAWRTLSRASISLSADQVAPDEKAPASGDSPLLDYPAPREDPLDIPADYLRLAANHPISRVRLANGAQAWLVTGHELARIALTHPKLSADASRPGFPRLLKHGRRLSLSTAGTTAVQSNMTFMQMDPPHHDAIRAMLRGSFSPGRVHAMLPMMQQTADSLVGNIVSAGPPADLIGSFAAPFPSAVICEMLGVPVSEREMFERETNRVLTISSSQRAATMALRVFNDYITELIARPGEMTSGALISQLVKEFLWTGQISHDDLVSTIRLLLMAGLETTASMIGLSFTQLLCDRELYCSMRDRPVIIRPAIDELLRFHAIAHHGVRRLALEDLRLGPVLVRQGEGVIVSVAAANRDPSVFEQPNRIDLSRNARTHLSFSGGVHFCLGHLLARAELEIALATVTRALPGLRLSGSLADLSFRDDTFVYGVKELPVVW